MRNLQRVRLLALLFWLVTAISVAAVNTFYDRQQTLTLIADAGLTVDDSQFHLQSLQHAPNDGVITVTALIHRDSVTSKNMMGDEVISPTKLMRAFTQVGAVQALLADASTNKTVKVLHEFTHMKGFKLRAESTDEDHIHLQVSISDKFIIDRHTWFTYQGVALAGESVLAKFEWMGVIYRE